MISLEYCDLKISRESKVCSMMFGQRYKGRGRVSSLANYVQLDITGLNATDIVRTYFELKIDKPIILFLDNVQKQEDKNFLDDILKAEKIYDVKDAIVSLKAFGADVLALTLTPVSRDGLSNLNNINKSDERIVKTIGFNDWMDKLNDIYKIPVLAKNTKDKELFLSYPEEIIEFSKSNKITLDSIELVDILIEEKEEQYLEFIHRINRKNIQEVHLKDIESCKKISNYYEIDTYNTFTTYNYDQCYQKLLNEFAKHIADVPWATLLLHGSGGSGKEFEKNVKIIQDRIG